MAEIREFYEGMLGLTIGTYVRENLTVPDCSDNYVNYYLDGGLLCFETENGRTDIGTVVLNVENFAQFKKDLEGAGVNFLASNEAFLKIKDPDGRSLIIEPLIRS